MFDNKEGFFEEGVVEGGVVGEVEFGLIDEEWVGYGGGWMVVVNEFVEFCYRNG